MKALRNFKVWLGCVVFVICMIGQMSVAFAATDLKLNPDILRAVRDEGMNLGTKFKAEDLFLGMGAQSITFAEATACFGQYGMTCEYYEETESTGIATYNLLVTVDDMDLDFSAVDVNTDRSDDFYDELSFSKNAVIWITFLDDTFISSDLVRTDEIIEVIEYTNNGGTTVSTEKNGWLFESNAWRYYENNAMVTGFKWINDELYYFNENGEMVHNCFMDIDGKKYHFNDDWADRGWQQIDGTWYYFNMEEAYATTGWLSLDGEWYYFNANGQMVHNCFLEIDGQKYHFNDNWADRGWQQIDEEWYYFDTNTAAASMGYIAGIEGDSYKYFFYTDSYTDQNGTTHEKGVLAVDTWVLQNGTLTYCADQAGHLYTNTSRNYNGTDYIIDETGVVLVYLKPYTNSAKNYNGNDYSAFHVVAGYQEEYCLNQKNYKYGNQGCSITSIAIAQSILKGSLMIPTDFDYMWSDKAGMNNWKDAGNFAGKFTSYAYDNLRNDIVNVINQGLPVIMTLWENSGTNHYVVIIGIRSGVNTTDLSTSDFLIADPGTGEVKTLDEELGTNTSHNYQLAKPGNGEYSYRYYTH